MPPFLADKRVLATISVLAILVSLISIISGRRSSGPPIDTELHRTVGQVFATETMKVLTGGDQLVLVVPVCRQTPLRAVELQVDGFEKTLKQFGRGHILARETLDAPTPDVGELLTADTYARLAAKYPSAAAIIAFAGIKSFGETDLTADAGKPPLCVLSMSEPVQKALIEQGIVKLAVIPRGWAQDESAADAPSQPNGFNNDYAIVKP